MTQEFRTSKTNSIKLALKTPLTLMGAFKEIGTTPKMMLYLIPPYIVGGVTAYFVFFGLSEYVYTFLSNWIIPTLEGWPNWITFIINHTIIFFVQLLTWLVSGIASALAGIFALLVLSGYFVECFIELALIRHNLPKETSATFISSMVRGLKDQTQKLIILGILGLFAFVASFIPILAPFAILLGVLIVGFDLFDMPLTLTGLTFKERMKIILKRGFEVLAMGGIFAVATIIPTLPILLLPLGYLAAIKNMKEWSQLKELTTPQNPLH